MDQLGVSREESEALSALSEKFFNCLAVPIPSVPASDVFRTQTAHQKHDITIAGVKIPNYRYIYDFNGLAFRLTYKKFVIRLAELNPNTLTRPAAEKAWQTLILDKFKEWKPDPKLYSSQKKRRLWRDAYSQMCGKGLNDFNVERFWRNWEMIVPPGRKEKEAREECLRNETIMQEKWGKKNVKREENRKVRMRAKNHGVVFCRELQLRPKPSLQSEQAILCGPAVLSGVPEQKFNGQDDEMKL